MELPSVVPRMTNNSLGTHERAEPRKKGWSNPDSNPIMNMPTVPRLLRLRGNESVTNKLFLSTEALPTEARYETRAGVVFPGVGCRFHTQHAISRGRRCDEEGDYLNAQLYAVDGSQPSA